MKFLTLLSLSWQHILIVLLIIIPVYFIPTFVASSRKKANTSAIFILNLFLGWSLIGWVVALVWALSNNETNQQVTVNSQNNYTNIDQLTKLKELHDKGVITDKEFIDQKNKLLS
ncbi:hypothetical protein BA768_00705 [Chryseobacterium sp. CBo1]|uniref:superinfection immunity protein n=1 Tax=Chryseobacterium sp. CBo1 TaxID=1869230 RepID=UPI00081072AF|nr:superinfection immunity protein [Chryseobacterium sp. CBo1]OCK53110.1 hypothetical protein BA768_00705 [Chryseobacterium sp. CBo1]